MPSTGHQQFEMGVEVVGEDDIRVQYFFDEIREGCIVGFWVFIFVPRIFGGKYRWVEV